MNDQQKENNLLFQLELIKRKEEVLLKQRQKVEAELKSVTQKNKITNYLVSGGGGSVRKNNI